MEWKFGLDQTGRAALAALSKRERNSSTFRIGYIMNMKFAASFIVAAALLLPIAGYGADSPVAATKTFVKDSVITTKVKAKLAEEKLSSLVKISVDTDDKGMVNLGGTAANKAAADKAVAIARTVEGVKSVENHIAIKADK